MESGKIIVVANQKGGVAKTSTVRNLSYALAEMGKKVLVVDFDPQYNLTTSFGVLPTQAPYNTGTLITNLLLDESLPDTNEFIQKIGSVDLIPSSRSLTVAEANLLMTPDSNDYLAALLNPLRLSYDYITRDNLALAYLKIYPISTELFSKNEKRLIAKQLTQTVTSGRATLEVLNETFFTYLGGLNYFTESDAQSKLTYADLKEHIGVDCSEYRYEEEYQRGVYTWYAAEDDACCLSLFFGDNGKLIAAGAYNLSL